jgi:hypothetical protein
MTECEQLLQDRTRDREFALGRLVRIRVRAERDRRDRIAGLAELAIERRRRVRLRVQLRLEVEARRKIEVRVRRSREAVDAAMPYAKWFCFSLGIFFARSPCST